MEPISVSIFFAGFTVLADRMTFVERKTMTKDNGFHVSRVRSLLQIHQCNYLIQIQRLAT